MKTTEIKNGNIVLGISEGFLELSFQDIEKMGRTPEKNSWSIRNEKEHLILEIAWKKAPFFSDFVKMETTAHFTEDRISKMIPTYKKESDIKKEIDGEEACGFRYSYTVSDINMMADYLVLKHEKKYYSISWIARKDTFSESYDIFDSMMQSFEFV